MEKENNIPQTPVNISPHKERECACGCGTIFIPRRRDQIYVNSNHANYAYNHGKRKQKSKNQVTAEKQLRLNDKLLDKFYKLFTKTEAIVFSMNLKAEGFDPSFFIGCSTIGERLYYKSYNYLFLEYEKEGMKLIKILTQKSKIRVKRRGTSEK